MTDRDYRDTQTGTVEARCDLSISYGRLGNICKAQGRLTEAQQYYEQSLQIDEQLAEQCPEVPEYAQRRDLAKDALAKL